MKIIQLNLTLKFDEDICDDNEIAEVVQNVLNALIYHRDNIGLAPSISEAITLKIEVSEPFTETILSNSINDF